jgi:hypothetical protein
MAMLRRLWGDWRRGYSDRDMIAAMCIWNTIGKHPAPGSFVRCTQGELRAMVAIYLGGPPSEDLSQPVSVSRETSET